MVDTKSLGAYEASVDGLVLICRGSMDWTSCHRTVTAVIGGLGADWVEPHAVELLLLAVIGSLGEILPFVDKMAPDTSLHALNCMRECPPSSGHSSVADKAWYYFCLHRKMWFIDCSYLIIV